MRGYTEFTIVSGGIYQTSHTASLVVASIVALMGAFPSRYLINLRSPVAGVTGHRTRSQYVGHPFE
jgi:hypothetical protein